jgi:hypothetical protein
MKNSNGFGIVGIILVITVVSVAGIAGWRIYLANNKNEDNSISTAKQIEPSKQNQKQTTEEPTETTEKPIPSTEWVEYRNDEYGFSFSYPSSWGSVVVGEASYGSEERAGPRRSLTFTTCSDCKPDSLLPIGSSTPEIALNSKDFGGIGSSRPFAVEAGYKKINDSTYAVYKYSNTEEITDKNTLEVSLINDVLFYRIHDSFHEIYTTYAVANINGGQYTGVGFIIHDNVGETTNSETLRSIIKTFKNI